MILASFAAEERLRGIPWGALDGLAPLLERTLVPVLAGDPADAALARLLRSAPGLDGSGRAAAAEAVLGVALWRRRLAVQLGVPSRRGVPLPRAAGERVQGEGAVSAPRLLLGGLLRDLGGRADAESLAGLDPGTLPPPRPPPTALADRFSFPDWLAAELRAAAGDEAEALANALDLPGPIFLRVNLLRTTIAALAARLAAEGVATGPGRLAPHCLCVATPRPNVYGLAAHRDGLFEVQDEGSQLLGAIVGARPGETALDACAGAGGKTLLLAAEVGDAGRVHAADPDAGKLARLRERAARAGAAGIVVVDGDAPAEGLVADRVLVDAPCSELGALRRGPDLRWRMDPAAFQALPALQLEILARAARHVRPDGTLVYATCTLRREENEEVALAFEASHPGFARQRPHADGDLVGADGFLRTWPHRHGTDAFFVAVWMRRG